ncbi:DUF2304 domain-containing protein [Pseudoduganella ginsengisoli]|uniref:DUF2304 family protein n=1 Tax=Pseudoduganella ginsengisoli TaxID=1462440 RepID=A0A6L6PUE3_9BURK|nr:DUF2304 domain-containing protein [Pseudoduganella ginsengisoli]MTW00816.1 DUF2304 family protein [Pseudoduganella ginsengisoli]
MIVQILLSIALACAWIYVLTQGRFIASLRFALYGVIVCGTYFVWWPDDSTRLAHMLGVGRGADLVFYVWVVLSFGIFINIHSKLRQNQQQLTELARHLAIDRAERPADDAR